MRLKIIPALVFRNFIKTANPIILLSLLIPMWFHCRERLYDFCLFPILLCPYVVTVTTRRDVEVWFICPKNLIPSSRHGVISVISALSL